MKTVVIESPWRSDTKELADRNSRYLEACIVDCLRRGESPYASHKMLTDALDDRNEAQRKAGIEAGFVWAALADARVFYTDLGVSHGMFLAVVHAADIRQVVEYRTLGGGWVE
ncbi:MAG: hypothetical protein A2Y75_01560 [Candidatus Solincola sediminis]|uniref:DUF7768 domain-containing protein n=1 Tax=Candidatus Solincola sediminis TaxID=1797199 RepID=A0A1F2WNJ2_9ACTN|nr:MAG: hypothetical protein A2Y75_01560 [Candidatus Solincola sediminis]